MLEKNESDIDKETIHIACTPDNNYAQHCGVMLASLFENNKGVSLKIHLLYTNLSDSNRHKLEQIVIRNGSELEFYRISSHLLSSVPLSHHISEAAYYRFFLPILLSANLKKILYLDSDLIVRKGLSPLWNIELNDFFYVGAVQEMISANHLIKIGLQKDTPYFNTGVLLVNLEKWRSEDVFTRAFDFISKNPNRIIFWDQDVMNILFEGKWQKLEYTWNISHYFYMSAYSAHTFGLTQDEFSFLQKDPSILHFSGHIKPWDYKADHPMKNEYYKYIRYTPWKNFKGFGAPTFFQKLFWFVRFRLLNLNREK